MCYMPIYNLTTELHPIQMPFINIDNPFQFCRQRLQRISGWGYCPIRVSVAHSPILHYHGNEYPCTGLLAIWLRMARSSALSRSWLL